MAVVITGSELFVNSTWTTANKVPAKSPFGVELVYGENAFATLDEAIAYATTWGLPDVQFIVGDKTVAVSDAAGEVTYISSKEIKGTETVKETKTGTTYTAQSKQSVANQITFDNSGAGTADTLAGFKEVIVNGGSATVLGGANTVTHVYAFDITAGKTSSFKDSGTVNGKADGILTVNGAAIAATGAWAEVQSENNDEITLDAAAFKLSYPGQPSSTDWDDSDESILAYLPGYATVTLTDGASVEELLGGSLDFTHAADTVYTVTGETNYLSSLNKTLAYTRKNSGKLTVTDSVIGTATGYATAIVTGANTDFESLDNESGSAAIKTTFKDTRSDKNTTVKETADYAVNEAANGTLTVEGIGFDGEKARDVRGFSKVTVKDARIGHLRANGEKYSEGGARETVTTPTAGGSSVKVTTSAGGTENSTAGGTLATAPGNTSAAFTDIMGFSKVDLVNATVEEDIRIAGGGRPGSFSVTATSVVVDDVFVQSKTIEKQDFAAAGTVTMTGGSVGGDIEGAATVKLTGTTVGSIDEGGIMKGNYSEELSLNSKTNALTSSYSSSSAGQLKGTVTMNGGAVEDCIDGYQTMMLDGANVSGSINESDSYKTTFSGYKNEFIDSGVTLMKQTYSSGFTYAPTAALTLTNGATVAGSALGVKTLTLSSGAEISGFVEMRNGGMQEISTVTSKGGLYTENYQYSSGNAAPGTVTATGATAFDTLRAAGKVTATDAILDNIDGYSSSTVIKYTQTGSALGSSGDRYYVNGYSGTVSLNNNSTYSAAAAGNATLTRTTAGNLYGVATVKLTDGSVEGASAGNSKSIDSIVSSVTAYNAVYSDTWNTVGNFTATSGGVMGNIVGYSTVMLDHTKAMGGVVGSEFAGYRFGSKNVSSSLKQTFANDGATLLTQNFASANSYAPTATLTLKNGAFVAGNAEGIKTLNIGAGTVIGGDVFMANYTMKDTGSITSKAGVYEQTKQYTSSQGVAGAATITGIAGGTDQVCGNISGAAKVTVTDAVIGGLTNYGVVQSDSWIRRGAEVSSYYQSRYIYEPTEYTSTYGFSQHASGTATLTRTNVGQIVNFATVKMTDGEISRAFAGGSGSSFATTLQGGVYTFSQVSSSCVDGTFTAANAEITGDGEVLTRFAKVTLTDCELTGADTVILGGDTVENMNGSGATIAEAIAAAEANKTTTFTAAGMLTAKATLMDGSVVCNYATVTLTDCVLKAVVIDDGNTAKTALTLAGTANVIDDGDGTGEFLIDRYANVTVKSGWTVVGGGFRGTDDNDSVIVNAKSELDIEGAAEFGAGTDAFTVNGTARVAGDFDADNLEKLSGSGMLALNNAGAAALRASIDAGTTSLSGKIEIIAAGSEVGDVLAVRTKKEELSDNTVANARRFTGEDMAGWLSGVEDADAYQFADMEDWISFTDFDGLDYGLDLSDATRNTDLTAELFQNGTKLSDLVWNDMEDRFEIDTALAAGTEYQLRLTVEEGTSALSYAFSGRFLA